MRVDLRCFCCYRRIDVADLIACFTHEGAATAEEDLAVNALVSHIGWGEVYPDITEGSCSKEGVTYSVEEDVCIGVTFEALLKGDLHAAEPKLVAVTEAVDVIAEARPERYLWHIYHLSSPRMPSISKASVKRRV